RGLGCFGHNENGFDADGQTGIEGAQQRGQVNGCLGEGVDSTIAVGAKGGKIAGGKSSGADVDSGKDRGGSGGDHGSRDIHIVIAGARITTIVSARRLPSRDKEVRDCSTVRQLYRHQEVVDRAAAARSGGRKAAGAS